MGGFSRTEQRLREAWGAEGAYFWRLLLDAAARELEPGTFTYRNDSEAWAKFGVSALAFSLDEFFALTGRMRQTKKTSRNRITVVTLSNWGEWQNVRKQTSEDTPNVDQTLTEREPNADRSQTARVPNADVTRTERTKKSRSGAQNADKIAARSEHDTDALPTPTYTYTDTSTEPPLVPLSGNGQKRRARDHLFDALVEVCSIEIASLTPSGRGPLNRALKELRQVDATPDEVHRRAGIYGRRYALPLTPSALAKHWGALNVESSNGRRGVSVGAVKAWAEEAAEAERRELSA